VDYILMRNRARGVSPRIPCVVCGAREAPHLLEMASQSRALCDDDAQGLEDSQHVSATAINGIRRRRDEQGR
jgi:hypothetical protein